MVAYLPITSPMTEWRHYLRRARNRLRRRRNRRDPPRSLHTHRRDSDGKGQTMARYFKCIRRFVRGVRELAAVSRPISYNGAAPAFSCFSHSGEARIPRSPLPRPSPRRIVAITLVSLPSRTRREDGWRAVIHGYLRFGSFLCLDAISAVNLVRAALRSVLKSAEAPPVFDVDTRAYDAA